MFVSLLKEYVSYKILQRFFIGPVKLQFNVPGKSEF